MNAVRMLLLLAALALPLNAVAADKTLMMATTTSTDDSGLLDFLKPSFEKETGIIVHYTI